MSYPDTGDRTLAKIRALLAQAEHPTTGEVEAEAFTARAAEMIAKYGIDEALLSARQEHREQVGVKTMVFAAPYAYEKAVLLHNVARAMGGKIVMQSKGGSCAKLYGMPADLVRIELLYTSLLLQSARELTRSPAPYYESPVAWKRSWLRGYAAAVGRRLVESERVAEQAATAETGASVALVLVSRKSQVAAKVAEDNPNMGKGRRSTTRGSGGHAGREAAGRANLGGTTVGGGARRAIA